MISNRPDLFMQLYDCLKRQEEILDRLTALGQAQLAALRRHSLEELGLTVQEQEACATEMERAEEQRLLLSGELEQALNLQRGVALTELLTFATGPVRGSLQQLLPAIKEKIKTFQDLNTLNSTLLKRSQHLNNRLIKILSSDTATTYGLKGEVRSGLKQMSVLNKSV